jgi:hypothetical protein
MVQLYIAQIREYVLIVLCLTVSDFLLAIFVVENLSSV